MAQRIITRAPPNAGQFPIIVGPADLAGIRTVEVDNGSALTLSVFADNTLIRVVPAYVSRFSLNTGGAWGEIRITSNGATIQATDSLTVVCYETAVVPPLTPSFGVSSWGAGAVPSTLQDVNPGDNLLAWQVEQLVKWARGRYYDITQYGAVSGQDSTAAIQAANDAAVAASPADGIVYFPPGTWISSGNLFDSFLTYQGAGVDATVVQLKAGTHAPVFKSRNFDALSGSGSNAGEHHFAFRDMTIFGDKLNNLGDNVPLIEIYGYGYLLQNLVVWYGRSEGIYSEWGAATVNPPAVGDHTGDATWINVLVHDCDCQGFSTGGIDFRGPHDSRWFGVEQANNGVSGNGIYVGTAGAGLLAVNCHAIGVNGSYSWQLDGLAFLVNCYGEGGTLGQLLVNASDTVVSGGVYHNGSIASANATGIIIGNAAANCRIDTKVLRCLLGAISYSSSGGSNHIALNITQTSGPIETGTPNLTDDRSYLVSGGASGQAANTPIPITIIRNDQTYQLQLRQLTGTPARYGWLIDNVGTLGFDDIINVKRRLSLAATGGWYFGDTFVDPGANNVQVQNWLKTNRAYVGDTPIDPGADNFQAQGWIAAGLPEGGSQVATHLWMGNGVPSATHGANGDYYLRADGVAANTHVYHREAGAWVGIA